MCQTHLHYDYCDYDYCDSLYCYCYQNVVLDFDFDRENDPSIILAKVKFPRE